MSSSPGAAGSGAPPVLYDGGESPLMRRQQQSYSFSGRVLLTAVVILAILTVVFVLIRLLLYQFVARGGRGGGLAAGVRRSFGSFGRSGRHGLDAAALAALPVTAYRRSKQPDDGEVPSSASAASTSGSAAATECAVCLSELADGEKVRALPSCGHVFHVECVDAWLRSRTTCPVCRAQVRPSSKQGAAAGDARPSAPAPFGAGGTLVVTVEGGVAETRDTARASRLGAAVNRPAGP
ncbi:unnamed protein product [Urochloa decumbens]|uniref:RING-type E3 ubiquitin transferase n=1 Tax=Urochloa decumbens TaxID=240449 RepID=A0ABC8ZSR2_9POAL